MPGSLPCQRLSSPAGERHSRACSISGQFDIGEAGFSLRPVAVSEFPVGLISWWTALAVRRGESPSRGDPISTTSADTDPVPTRCRHDNALHAPPTAHPQIGKGRCQVDNCGSLLAGFCRRDRSATERLVSFWPLVPCLRCVNERTLLPYIANWHANSIAMKHSAIPC